MDFFSYKNQELYVEDVPLSQIALNYQTPTYVYSKATLNRHYTIFRNAFGKRLHQICYAVKANSNLSLLQELAALGSGFDIVSKGELQRVLMAGGKASQTVFSGVGKQEEELSFALDNDILCFNIESEDELFRLNALAKAKGKRAPIAIRVNPDVDSKSHPFISTGLKTNKFGVPLDQALSLYIQAAQMPNLKVIGLASHIGSQILEVSPFVEATRKLTEFYQRLQAHQIKLDHIDLGGGLGVPYTTETPPSPKAWLEAMLRELPSPSPKIIIEPGRALVANAGVLLTKVITVKANHDKLFAIVDCGMNDYIRPALYNAKNDILPIKQRDGAKQSYDVVGPICETGDFLGKSQQLPPLVAGDLLCIRGVGAYGFAMSSNYNTRPRAMEVLVHENQTKCIRDRETIDDILALELNHLDKNTPLTQKNSS